MEDPRQSEEEDNKTGVTMARARNEEGCLPPPLPLSGTRRIQPKKSEENPKKVIAVVAKWKRGTRLAFPHILPMHCARGSLIRTDEMAHTK